MIEDGIDHRFSHQFKARMNISNCEFHIFHPKCGYKCINIVTILFFIDLRDALCLQILAALFQGKGSKVKLLHLIKVREHYIL